MGDTSGDRQAEGIEGRNLALFSAVFPVFEPDLRIQYLDESAPPRAFSVCRTPLPPHFLNQNYTDRSDRT